MCLWFQVSATFCPASPLERLGSQCVTLVKYKERGSPGPVALDREEGASGPHRFASEPTGRLPILSRSGARPAWPGFVLLRDEVGPQGARFKPSSWTP